MPDRDGVLTPAEAAKQAVDDFGNPLSKYQQAKMRRELEDFKRSHSDWEPPPKPPTRVWMRVSLAPSSMVKLDEIGESMGESKRGRVLDKLIEHWTSTHD